MTSKLPGSSRKSLKLARIDALRRFTGRLLQSHVRALRIKLGMPVQPGAIILTYHRIADADSDPLLLCVSPSRFADHMEVIRQRYHPISLQSLVQRVIRKETLSGLAAVTFDDGYADNLQHAKPLLERYEVPATVFVASDGVGRSTEFPWDELERLLLLPGTVPETLQLQIANRHYSWSLGTHAHYDQATYRRYRKWNVQEQTSPTYRHQVYRNLGTLLNPLGWQERQAVLDHLRRWAGVAPPGRQTVRTLTVDELLSLADSSLLDIGAHTATHPVLCMQSLSEQESEIKGSKDFLEEILGREIKNFAYPYGSLRSFDARTIRIVKKAGFHCACSTLRAVVTQRCDLFQLPRFGVRNWDGDEFAKRMQDWMHS